MPSIFDQFVAEQEDNPLAAEMAARPLRRYCSDARILDSGTAIVVTSEPDFFRQLTREWHDRDTTEALAEAVHQLELERASKPPVIEVTVTTPPTGIPRAELGQLVQDTVARITGPQPVLPPGDWEIAPAAGDGYVPGALGPPTLNDLPRWQERPSRMLTATRKVRDKLAARGQPSDAAEQTQMLPAITDEPEPGRPHVYEVHLP